MIEFKRSHLPTLGNDDGYFGFIVGTRRNVLDLPDNQQPLDDSAKDHVLGIEKVAFGARDEELAPVGVLAGIGHG